MTSPVSQRARIDVEETRRRKENGIGYSTAADALQLTRDHPGHIPIQIKVEAEEMVVGVIQINDGDFEDAGARAAGPP